MSNSPLIKEITDLTMRLKNEHQDVYDRLDENPITLKLSRGHGASDQELKEYLQTLKDLLEEHRIR